MSEDLLSLCPTCGQPHAADACEAMRTAAAAGAQPKGVPLRIYGGYLEGRAALRANVPSAAIRVLQWLLGHIAEERGARADLSFPAKLDALCDDGVISPRVREALVERALSPDNGPQTAWALMSLVEHALARLYLHPSR